MNAMMTLLVWAVSLGLIQVVLMAMASVRQRGLDWAVSARDQSEPLSGVAGRLQRVLANFMETFPFFVALALMAIFRGHDEGHMLLGAQLYFWSRVAYIPVYAAGIPWLRTLIWTASIVGLVMMLVALF